MVGAWRYKEMTCQKIVIALPFLLILSALNSLASGTRSLAEIYKQGRVCFNAITVIGKAELKKVGFIGKPAALAGDDEGNIYILDTEARNIKKFDDSGSFLSVLGEKRANVSFFVSPETIAFVKDRLVIWDNETLRLYTMTPEGRIINSKKFSVFSAWPRKIREWLNGDMMICSFNVNFHKTREPQSFILELFSPEMKIMRRIVAQDLWVWTYNDKLEKRISVPFHPSFFWDLMNDGKIVWGFSDKYEIIILDPDSGKEHRFSHTYIPVKVTPEDISEYFSTYIYTMNGRKAPIPDIIKKSMIFPEYKPAFYNIFVDGENNILISTYYENKSIQKKRFDAFDSTGRFLNEVEIFGEAVFPESSSKIHFHENHVWLIESPDPDQVRLVKYRISEVGDIIGQ
jgi:hypothetical protein